MSGVEIGGARSEDRGWGVADVDPVLGSDGGPVIRDVVLDDAEAIGVFQTLCWREAYAGLVPAEYLVGVDEDVRAARWRDRVASGERSAALAEHLGQVVGVVSWGLAEVADAPPLELKSLYVGAAYRGSGVAERLLTRAIGDGAAHLWVFRDNSRAQAFYRKHGFAPDGAAAIDPDTGVPEVRMSRR